MHEWNKANYLKEISPWSRFLQATPPGPPGITFCLFYLPKDSLVGGRFQKLCFCIVKFKPIFFQEALWDQPRQSYRSLLSSPTALVTREAVEITLDWRSEELGPCPGPVVHDYVPFWGRCWAQQKTACERMTDMATTWATPRTRTALLGQDSKRGPEHSPAVPKLEIVPSNWWERIYLK